MRYLLTFSYDGSAFFGYQKQKSKRTVQFEIETVLSKLFNQKVLISASGRTDAKVHANNQKAHFDVNKAFDCLKIKDSLNKMLPEDIYIKSISKVDISFHARYSVLKKEYLYKINVGEYNPFERNYVYQLNKKLDIEKMRLAIKDFIGENDYKSFSKSDYEEKDTIREIYKADIICEGSIITIDFIGNGFLRYMVRNMVGYLIQVGEGAKDCDVSLVLSYKDRTKAGITAPPEGLYLNEVFYN
ncbi:MAG: tRNA pseudouridine(38-40) synthase TruA [Bacilli bacterium]|nr:tRNA pseudouridine(38-40) synthase TruA [Bacilli bacterium]